MTATEWQAAAAYLYVLHLRPAELAWEYLRRNLCYRTDWQMRRLAGQRVELWGLQFR